MLADTEVVEEIATYLRADRDSGPDGDPLKWWRGGGSRSCWIFTPRATFPRILN